MKKCSNVNCKNPHVSKNGLLKFSHFHKDICTKDGFESRCKHCKSEYYIKTKELKEAKRKEREKIIGYRKTNKKEKKCITCKKTLKINNFYRSKCHLDGYRNECKICKYKRAEFNIKARIEKDPIFKLKLQLKTVIRDGFRRAKTYKSKKASEILGCTIEEFYIHLKQTFINNYNRDPVETDILHIDHIIPISTAKTEKDVYKLNHYSNLQWLLKEDNLSKSNKLDWKL